MEGRYAYSCRKDYSIVDDCWWECGFDGAIVELRFCNKVEKPNHCGGGDAVVLNSYRDRFCSPFLDLSEDMDMKPWLLLFARIPRSVRNAVVAEAISFARRMHAGVGILLPIVVDVVVRTWQSPFESEKEAIIRSLTDSLNAARRDDSIVSCQEDTSKRETMNVRTESHEHLNTTSLNVGTESPEHYIQSLEYMKVDLNMLEEEASVCNLCSQNLSFGMVVARMSCSHISHVECNLNRLMFGLLCKLCHPRDIDDYWDEVESDVKQSGRLWPKRKEPEEEPFWPESAPGIHSRIFRNYIDSTI